MKTRINKSSLLFKMPKQRESVSAFTLIELMVVIAIIAILAALAVPALTSALAKSQMSGALKVYLVKDADPSSAIFCASHNYVYNTGLLNTDVPYGTKGFIVMKKGGDAAVFKEGQATQAPGWPDVVTFQTQVGMMPGDVEGILGTESNANRLQF